MSSGYLTYLDVVRQRLDEAAAQAETAIATAAQLVADTLIGGRPLFVFGATHAGLLAQDVFYRAGGLMRVEPILPAGLMLNERPVTRTSQLERLPGFGELLLHDVPLRAGDVLLVISVSGRNPAAVELAAAAQARDATVIALTSLTYSRSVTPRGDQRLYEVADHVIDLPGCVGDAAVTLPGLPTAVGPTSTAVGSAMLQGLVVEIATRVLHAGGTPEVFVSGNLDEGDVANRHFDRDPWAPTPAPGQVGAAAAGQIDPPHAATG